MFDAANWKGGLSGNDASLGRQALEVENFLFIVFFATVMIRIFFQLTESIVK